jgi:hypothetical protein
MTKAIYLDAEIRPSHSVAFGPHRALGAASHIFCVAYEVKGSNTPKVWRYGEDATELASFINDPQHQLIAHNAIFDALAVERFVPGVLPIDRNRLNCTSARAACHGLPSSQEGALVAINAPAECRKDSEGKAFMLRFIEDKKGAPRLEPETSPEEFERMVNYCVQDLKGLKYLDENLPELSSFERDVWLATLEKNKNGVKIHKELVERVTVLAFENQKQAEIEFAKITNGIGARSAKKVLQWFQSRLPEGTETPPGVAKDTLPRWGTLLANDPEALRALKLKPQAGTSPGVKLSKMLEQACEDGRTRDLFRYAETQTKRWASGSDAEAKDSGSNIQNLNRPSLEDHEIDAVRETVLSGGNLDDIELLVGDDVRGALSSLIRSVIIPEEGLLFADRDYSKIEPIVLAVVTNNQDRLRLIRLDADLYIILASKIFQIPVEQVSKRQRQVGKLGELLCGYQGGANKLFESMIAANIEGATYELAEKVVTVWRRENIQTVRCGNELMAAFGTCCNTGKEIPVAGGRARFVRDKEAIRLVLPSGESLYYRNPTASQGYDGRWNITFLRPKGTSMVEVRPHSGLFLENLASGISRDILAHALVSTTKAGLKVVLTAHDQMIVEGTEADDALLKQIMEDLPPWAKEFDIKAEGGTSAFFKK